MGEIDTIQVQSLRKHSYKQSRLNIEAVTIANNWEIALLYVKREEPQYIEISTPIFLEVWLFWCETGMFPLDLKWLPSKKHITELKI